MSSEQGIFAAWRGGRGGKKKRGEIKRGALPAFFAPTAYAEEGRERKGVGEKLGFFFSAADEFTRRPIQLTKKEKEKGEKKKVLRLILSAMNPPARNRWGRKKRKGEKSCSSYPLCSPTSSSANVGVGKKGEKRGRGGKKKTKSRQLQKKKKKKKWKGGRGGKEGKRRAGSIFFLPPILLQRGPVPN